MIEDECRVYMMPFPGDIKAAVRLDAEGFPSIYINDALSPQAILTAQNGGEMTDTSFKRAWDSYLHALSVAAGHPVFIRPHDLRHTYCTLLADAGVSIKQAMQWMGHADEKMILHVYDHVTAQRTENSVKKVESLLLSGQNLGQHKNQIRKTVEATTKKPDRVSDSDSEGHAFESHRAYDENPDSD